MTYWLNQRVGSRAQNKLEHYTEFPKKTKFTKPSHIPDNVKWARFRLNNKVRLIGFTADTSNLDELDKAKIENTFFVVFLDKDHEFYLIDK